MRLGPAAVALLGLPAIVGAQIVHGTVVDRGGLPVPGVVVLLIDSTSTTAARALTNEGGTFRLVGPHAGTYRLRTLRIGFRPILSDPLTLAAGQDLTERVELAGLPIALDTMRVSSRSQCHTVGDSGGATFRVWEQVRSALNAADITVRARVVNATTLEYQRALDPTGRVTSQSSATRSEYVTQPWRALSQDSLHRGGYVVDDVNGWTAYYAPGIETLLSDGFVLDHCFRLVSSRGQLGIAFEPSLDRDAIPEVQGTLWLDRSSAELRSLELRYVHIPREQANRASAQLTFARATNGMWLLTSWQIETPVVVRQVREPLRLGGISTPGSVETAVSEVRVHGGQLVLARRGSDTVWSGPRWHLSGTVTDSLSESPVADARVALLGTDLAATSDALGRFAMEGVLPGDYTLEARTASMDSVGAAYRRALAFTDSTVVHVRVPSAQMIRLTATRRIAGIHRFVAGVVIAENRSTPLAGADVSLPEINRSARTDEQGAFTPADVPIGPTHLIVRHLGFSPIDTTITIGTQSRFQFVLPTLQTLDSVVTSAQNVIPSFEENRRVGLGHFLTRADLAKVDELHLSAILATTPGAKFAHGSHGTWMIGGHGETSMGGSSALFYPNKEDQFRGAGPACYSLVYVDGALMFGARPPGGSSPRNIGDAAEPLFDLNSLVGSQIEAVEFYDGAAQTPMRYSTLNSQCGVLVIWSRKSTG